tara:strand:+ start:208 stop:441 length:234 start_codon:yes stop_codon:yes gene_type:complete
LCGRKGKKKDEASGRVEPATCFIVNPERTNLNSFYSLVCISVFGVCDGFVLHTGFIQWLSGKFRQQFFPIDIHTFAH